MDSRKSRFTARMVFSEVKKVLIFSFILVHPLCGGSLIRLSCNLDQVPLYSHDAALIIAVACSPGTA